MRNSTLLKLQTAIFAFLCVGISMAAAETGKPIQKKDFFPHSATTEKFNESWSYQFIFDNGTKAYMNIASLHIPASGRKIGCDLSFWNFKGKSYSVGRQYPKERLVTQKEKNRITIKEEYILENLPGKGHRVFFKTSKNGDFLLDLNFASAFQGIASLNNTEKLGKESYTQFLHIPYGRVSGIIAYNSDTLKVKGYAMMDHSYQTDQPTEIAKRIITFSTRHSNTPFSGKIGIDKNNKLFGYAIKFSAGNKTILKPASLMVNGKAYTGDQFPTGTLEIVWDDNSKTLIQANKPQQKFSLLNNFDGWLAKKAAKVMMGGEPFFYRGQNKDSEGRIIDWSISGL